MAGDKDHNNSDNNNNNDSWPWNDPMLQSVKAEHDRLMSELRASTTDLEKSSGSSSDNNPFAVFKHFVDSNLNSLSSAFQSLPSNIAEIKAKMQREEERRRQEELATSARWTGSRDTPDHIQMELSRSSPEEVEDAYDATIMLLAEAHRRNHYVSRDKIRALYDDRESVLGELDRMVNPMLAMGGAWFFTPETGDKIPVGQDKWRWLAPSPRWLSVNWFKRSPYSPIQLEAHPDLEESGKNWRAAFEDLMNAALDKPMMSRECVGMRDPHGKPQSTYYGPGLEWMLSLQCRGILPPLLPRLYSETNLTGSLPQVLEHLRQQQPNVPWSHEHRFGQTPLMRDLSDLMSEVGTKSTPDTEAVPLEGHAPLPATEQDLYECPYIMPPLSEHASTADLETAQRSIDCAERIIQAQIESQRAESQGANEDEEWENLREMVGEKRAQQEPVVQKKPDVLSALTTTRTTRLPDGTVTTEVVLKKRFSDGTETTEESVHTSNEALERHHRAGHEQQEKGQESKAKGWFWR